MTSAWEHLHLCTLALVTWISVSPGLSYKRVPVSDVIRRLYGAARASLPHILLFLQPTVFCYLVTTKLDRLQLTLLRLNFTRQCLWAQIRYDPQLVLLQRAAYVEVYVALVLKKLSTTIIGQHVLQTNVRLPTYYILLRAFS
jgi:hypothetical protein